jgi:hypothetical protein
MTIAWASLKPAARNCSGRPRQLTVPNQSARLWRWRDEVAGIARFLFTVAGELRIHFAARRKSPCQGNVNKLSRREFYLVMCDLLVDEAGAKGAYSRRRICSMKELHIRELHSFVLPVWPATVSGGYPGDGAPATEAQFHFPECVAVDFARNLYVCDSFNVRVREVSASLPPGQSRLGCWRFRSSDRLRYRPAV